MKTRIEITGEMVIAHAEWEARQSGHHREDLVWYSGFLRTGFQLACLLNGTMRQFYRKQIINWLPNLKVH